MEKNVYLYPCEKYDEILIHNAYQEILIKSRLLDGIKNGSKVGIKLNLVSALAPDKAATTHPLLVTELCKLLLAKKCQVTVGDSPGGLFTEGTLKKVYQECGLGCLSKLGVNLNYNTLISKISVDGYILHQLDTTSWLEEQDVIINFSKIKSHGMMGLSASVKNMFGVVPGLTKPEYHYRYSSHIDFANMLIDINEYYHPVINIIDAVIGMEGNGPTQGNPRLVGLLLASKSPYALDLLAAKIIGLMPEDVETINQSIKRGLAPKFITDLNLNIDFKPYIINDFKSIKPGKNMEFCNKWKGPFGKMVTKTVSKVLKVRPRVNHRECISCQKCTNICPVKAITMKKQYPKINSSLCIRCFCCQEFCPKGAIKVHKNLIIKILNHNQRSANEK